MAIELAIKSNADNKTIRFEKALRLSRNTKFN